MAYTTVTKVRQTSGFVGNSNVSDAFISNLITRAQGYVNSFLSDRYQLPLGKYYSNTITFSGTGSGTGTMTITIDGTSYEVAIASSLTAAQAADRFRTAALDNNSFVTDGLGNGATVTIYSIDPADAGEVTISSTDPQTVTGITATGGTVTEATIPMVEYLATEVAAAQLLITEFSSEAQDTDKDGYKRMALVTAILKSIQSGKEKLFDFAEVEIPVSNTKRVKFYPNATSENDPENPTKIRIGMNTKF